MRIKLKRHGNSQCFPVPKPILKLLNVEQEDEFELKTDGKRLIITPVKPEKTCESITL